MPSLYVAHEALASRECGWLTEVGTLSMQVGKVNMVAELRLSGGVACVFFFSSLLLVF